MAAERVSLTYRLVMAVATPVVKWWGRLKVTGADVVPPSGPLIVLVNHDSAWDPVVIGIAARGRQVCALAKASLWDSRPLGWVLDHMGQIPIERGRGDVAALSAALQLLRDGGCVGVFPEGTVSRGRALRPLSGAGRLAVEVPEARIVCAALTGAVDIVRFPRRPRIRVEFFEPEAGQVQPAESAIRVTRRTMSEIRARAPYAVPGRRRAAARFRELANGNAASSDAASSDAASSGGASSGGVSPSGASSEGGVAAGSDGATADRAS